MREWLDRVNSSTMDGEGEDTPSSRSDVDAVSSGSICLCSPSVLVLACSVKSSPISHFDEDQREVDMQRDLDKAI